MEQNDHTKRNNNKHHIPVSDEAEKKLMEFFKDNSLNFKEENERIFQKKVAKIMDKHQTGYSVLSQAEIEIKKEMSRLNQELEVISKRKQRLDQAKDGAIFEAKFIRDQSIRDFLKKQEESVKKAVDNEMKHYTKQPN